MKKFDNMRLFAWIEFALWLILVAVCVFGIRYHHYMDQKQYKSYQIFMNDVDGLIVGSPVRFLGVQIGNVTKIQILSSDIYIKFIITEKDLELPVGSVATVESSGLGGSKSLEIYPPKHGANKDKLIDSKDSTRLGKVIGLFKDIFKDIDEIAGNFVNASSKLNKEKAVVEKNVVTPAQADAKLKDLNQKLDKYIDMNNKFKKKIDSVKLKKEEVENGFEQSKSD
ncbi:MCE family protein [bacterium]|nr:MCE family protein [bacterium]